ncbi:MAG TPA: hypothetical protein RMF84_00520 [Polyangiaceae bacterium LLY-WYZ-14_1]|nr:hypothetical protein [Polyangiaceae bacterium LLY-WYZ-14_1]
MAHALFDLPLPSGDPDLFTGLATADRWESPTVTDPVFSRDTWKVSRPGASGFGALMRTQLGRCARALVAAHALGSGSSASRGAVELRWPALGITLVGRPSSAWPAAGILAIRRRDMGVLASFLDLAIPSPQPSAVLFSPRHAAVEAVSAELAARIERALDLRETV